MSGCTYLRLVGMDTSGDVRPGELSTSVPCVVSRAAPSQNVLMQDTKGQLPQFVLPKEKYRAFIEDRTRKYRDLSLHDFERALRDGKLDQESPDVSYLAALVRAYRG